NIVPVGPVGPGASVVVASKKETSSTITLESSRPPIGLIISTLAWVAVSGAIFVVWYTSCHELNTAFGSVLLEICTFNPDPTSALFISKNVTRTKISGLEKNPYFARDTISW